MVGWSSRITKIRSLVDNQPQAELTLPTCLVASGSDTVVLFSQKLSLEAPHPMEPTIIIVGFSWK